MDARLLCILCVGYFSIIRAASYEVDARWGQATVVINDALFIHGGKTDPYNSYGYTSAPNTNDTLYLSLSSSFNTSLPPWQLLSASSSSSTASPALSWHTLSAFNNTHLLLFGGQPGPNSPIVLTDVADSVFLVDATDQLAPSWTSEPVSWAGEPVRRIHHAATTSSSGIFITGGEMADDSGNVFSNNYIFNPNNPTFTLLPSDNAPPVITGHASILLQDGRILVFGGYSPTSVGLLPLSTIWVFDTSQSSPSWSEITTSNTSLPSPRRAFAATTTSDGMILIQGGSDVALQNNFEDGWILDPTQSPMIWTQVPALSQLGAQRDHFAVSSGNQVLFCFGYGNDGPMPVSLQIFNTDSNSFETVFSPPSSAPTTSNPSNPSQTSNQPLPTGSTIGFSSTGAHSTSTAETGSGTGKPNNGGNPNASDHGTGNKTTAIAVGSTLGLLGLVVFAIGGGYYLRRHLRQGSARRFSPLGGSDGFDDSESEHLAGEIPTAGPPQQRHTLGSHHGWDFGVLDTLGTALAIGTRNTRHMSTIRRDMLADEDTREFTPWYDKGRESTLEREWSLRSIISSLRRSREPSVAGSMGDASWREKTDPFSDEAALMREEDRGQTGVSARGRRQQSHASNRSYHDPFADTIHENPGYYRDDEDSPLNQPYLHPIPQQLPTLRTILPISQDGHHLSPVTEHTSRTTLNDINDTSTSVSSHTTSHNSPFDTISNITSNTSHVPPKSLLPYSSSIVGTSAMIKRSDSWWSRFARTSFLDRRSSSASRVPEFRDPNPPPRLDAIEESVRTGSVDRQPSDSSGPQVSPGVSRHVSRLQGGHNKSQTSVRTADTEAIERIAQTMDVAHLIRSDSRRTASTTTNLSIETRTNQWIHEERGARKDPEQIFASPVEMINAEGFSRQSDACHPSTMPMFASAVSVDFSPTSYSEHSVSSGVVAAKIQEIERRQSHDSEAPQEKQTKQGSKQRTNMKSVNYGLVPRASLFVANPDHKNFAI